MAMASFRRAERAAAGLSWGAGAIHGLVAPDHFSEWWGYGLFFVAAALGQVMFGLLVWTRGIETTASRSWETVRRKVYVTGIAGNLAIIGMWIVSRTVGIPVGPEAGVVEPLGVLDVVSKILEGVLIVVLALLLRRRGTDV